MRSLWSSQVRILGRHWAIVSLWRHWSPRIEGWRCSSEDGRGGRNDEFLYNCWLFVENVVKSRCWLSFDEVCSGYEGWTEIWNKGCSDNVSDYEWRFSRSLVVPFWVFNFVNISSWNVLKISDRLSHIYCASESVVLIKDGVVDWNVTSVFVILGGCELLFCKWLHAWMSVTCWNCSMEIWLSWLSLSWFSCWLSWGYWFNWLRLNWLSWLNRFWRLNNRLCWLNRLSRLNRFGWGRSRDRNWLYL